MQTRISNLRKAVLLMSVILLLTSCSNSDSNSSPAPQQTRALSLNEKLDFVKDEMNTEMRNLLQAYAGSDTVKHSRVESIELSKDGTLATINYLFNEDDYFSILWHQMYLTGQDFTADYRQETGNPFCRQFQIDSLLTLVRGYVLATDYEIHKVPMPKTGILVNLKNYSSSIEKDKYGNDLPVKIKKYATSKFGISTFDIMKIDWKAEKKLDLGKLSTLTPLRLPNVGYCNDRIVSGVITGLD